MRLASLIAFINKEVPFTYYKDNFPVNSPSTSARVKFTGGGGTTDNGIRFPTFQVLVRGEDTREGKQTAEAIAHALYDKLTNIQNVMIDGESISIIRCMNSSPLHIGQDENNNHVYSINFKMTIRP